MKWKVKREQKTFFSDYCYYFHPQFSSHCFRWHDDEKTVRVIWLQWRLESIRQTEIKSNYIVCVYCTVSIFQKPLSVVNVPHNSISSSMRQNSSEILCFGFNYHLHTILFAVLAHKNYVYDQIVHHVFSLHWRSLFLCLYRIFLYHLIFFRHFVFYLTDLTVTPLSSLHTMMLLMGNCFQ